jgi:alpha-1,6-mannosyltransferase
LGVTATDSQRAIKREPPPKLLAPYLLLGLLGTSMIAIGSWGIGWLPPDSMALDTFLVKAMRSTGGEIAAKILVFAGIAALLQAWLVLGHDLLAGARIRTRKLAGILAVWIMPLLLIPPIFSRDAYAYYAQGHLLANGYDPYTTGVSILPGWFLTGVDPMWSEAPAPYGPSWLIIEEFVAQAVGPRPFAAAIVFRMIAVIGVAGMAACVPYLARAHRVAPAKAFWLAAMNPLVLMHFVGGIHNDALMVALMLAAVLAAVSRRFLLAVVLVGLAGALKPIALLVLPFVGVLWAGQNASWRRRIFLWTVSLLPVAGVFLALSAVAGVGLGWVAALGTPGDVRTWLSPPTALGMAVGGLLESAGANDASDFAVTAFRAISMLIGALLCCWLVLRPEARSPVRGAGLALLAVAVLGPTVQPWYLLWSLPLLAVTGFTGNQLRIALLGTSALAVHGMAVSTSTSDTFMDFTDGIAGVIALGMITAVLLSSPGERSLILGHPITRGVPAARAPEDWPGTPSG